MSDEIRLWPGDAPGSEGWAQVEADFTEPGGGRCVRNVVVPTLVPMLPDAPTAGGSAVIIAPGGGFHLLSMDAEGTDVAVWLRARGVAAFVLKYRLVDTGPTPDQVWPMVGAAIAAAMARHPEGLDTSLAPEVQPLAVADGVQAVRVVRERAAEWGYRPDAIGFLGFSAGAFVASAVARSADPADRPDFLATVYGGSAGDGIPADAPPLWAMVCDDDVVTAESTVATYRAWRAAGRPAELHVYARGGHGFGANPQGLPVDTWIERLGDWMASAGYLPG